MRAIVPTGVGGPEVLQIAEVPGPVAGPGEILIEVRAAGVNRADLMQRAGRYPPPPGASPLLGLEASGIVSQLGEGVDGFAVGDRVMALLNGGGYAEHVVVPAGQALHVPDSLDDVHAAGVMEVFLTAWQALKRLGRLADGETALIHAAASGVGTAAVQIATALGARVIGTSRSADKLAVPVELGAEPLVPHDGLFSDEVNRLTGGRGVDVVFDLVGARYLGENVRCLARGGRIVCIGLLAGREAPLDLGEMLARHATIIGMTIRPLTADQKAELTQDFAQWGVPRLADGRIGPIIAATYPLEAAAEAHRLLETNDSVGKAVLTVSST
jgi:NADPH:quinone reductase